MHQLLLWHKQFVHLSDVLMLKEMEIAFTDALRLASGRILRAILNNPNFFPRERHATHAEFTHQLHLALLPSPSNLWYNQNLEAYSRFIEIPARTGNGRWAQLDDAHTIAILLRRPVGMIRNIPHAQLNNFTVQRTQQNIVEERTVVNPIVIWGLTIGSTSYRGKNC
uniref:Cytochrome P450 n=1 Tax=Globodera pallida TaxID=36090 RepID=A0A183BU28_GLOPA